VLFEFLHRIFSEAGVTLEIVSFAPFRSLVKKRVLRRKVVTLKKYPSLLAGTVVLLLILWGCTPAPATPERNEVGANSVVISTRTATPNSPAISETSFPTLIATQTPDLTGVLAGLSPINITLKLEQQNFTCTAVKKVTAHYERTCTKGTSSTYVFQVVISGRESFIVDFIETSVLQYSNPDSKTAIPIVGLMASMPYDGATPEEARAWVESTILALEGTSGDPQQNVFGGVKYVLYGQTKALTLEMGELP